MIFRFSIHNFFFVVLPGDIAWRLYDTYGFPIDLTQLMSEERGMTVDLEAYEKAKAAAILASQGIIFIDISLYDVDFCLCFHFDLLSGF